MAPGFFDAVDRPMLADRASDADDLERDRSAAIVNVSFAKEMLGRLSPVGQRLR